MTDFAVCGHCGQCVVDTLGSAGKLLSKLLGWDIEYIIASIYGF